MQEKFGKIKDLIHHIECETEKVYVREILTKFWYSEICVCYN